MRRSKAAVAAALLTVLVLLPLAAAPVAAGNAKDKAKAEHARIIKYWTAERIANAKTRDFVRTESGKFDPKAKPRPPVVVVSSRAPRGPRAAPSSSAPARSSSRWTAATGSARPSAVNDSRAGYSLVLTAGHCAYDEVNEAFATNWTYIPSFDTAPTYTCSQSTYGCWTASGLVVHSGYATAGGFNTQATVHDFAIAIVGPGGKTNSQVDALGSYPIAYPAISTGGSVHSFGYPASGKYKGKDLTYCAGPTFNDPLNDNLTWGIACNMTGGSSGGPWLANFTQAGGGTLTSLNSYGYGGQANMYGPKFDAKTQAVYNAANSRTSNYIVP